MKNPAEIGAMAVAKLGQKKEAIEVSVPNVELTWKFGALEIQQAKTYAEYMLQLKQIRQLPDFATFFDTRFVDELAKQLDVTSRPERRHERGCRNRDGPTDSEAQVSPAPRTLPSVLRSLKNPALAALFPLAVLVFWHFATYGRKFSLIPPPSEVAIQLYDLAFGGIYDDAFSLTLHVHLLASLSRVYGGFALAAPWRCRSA